MKHPRYILLGNGAVTLRHLAHARERGHLPELVVLNAPDKQRNADEIRALAETGGVEVLVWGSMAAGIVRDRVARDDELWLLSVYFGHILDAALLTAAAGRAVNLHAALLPWCRGVHTNIWPIIEHCPAGVTLHVMSPRVDAGAILVQREVPVHAWDTGASLYERLSETAVELLASAWPDEVLARWPGTPQQRAGSEHRLADFGSLAELTVPESGDVRRFFDVLRARSFPPYPGVRIRVGDEVVEATLQLRAVDDA